MMPQKSDSPKPYDSIAVLPLINLSGDSEQEYFTDGMTEALITNFAQIQALRVISRTSVMQYRGVKKPLPEIARELQVDVVLEGSVLRIGKRVRINAQLIEAATDHHLWAKSYERDLRDILTLQSAVAEAIVHEIRINVTPQEKNRLANVRPVDPEAHESYLKGRFFLNRGTEENTRKATKHFEQAIAEDASYAPAYAGLADAYLWLDDNDYLPEIVAQELGRIAAKKALELDELLAEAHSALAHLSLHAWDWTTTEAECRRGIELNPGHAMTRQWYAMYLSAIGRFDESIAEAKIAEEIDPLSLAQVTNVAVQLYHARRFDQAIAQAQKVLEIDPNYPRALRLFGQVYSAKGMYREAIAEYEKFSSAIGDSTLALAFLGNAFGLAGDRPRATQILNELTARSKEKYVSAFEIAIVFIGLGDNDPAFEWLKKAYLERSDWLVHMKVNPSFDPVRSDPRFADLLKKVGLKK